VGADPRPWGGVGAGLGLWTTTIYVSFLAFHKKRIFGDFFLYDIQYCFICRPTDATVSKDAGSNPGLLGLWHWQPDALTTRIVSHPLSAGAHPSWARSNPHSATSPHPRLDLTRPRLNLTHPRLDLTHPRLDLTLNRLDLALTRLDLILAFHWIHLDDIFHPFNLSLNHNCFYITFST
jgi:hypothetical protein